MPPVQRPRCPPAQPLPLGPHEPQSKNLLSVVAPPFAKAALPLLLLMGSCRFPLPHSLSWCACQNSDSTVLARLWQGISLPSLLLFSLP